MKSSLREFFENNSSLLDEFYPGISYERLLLEFKEAACSEINFINSLKQGIPLSYISNKAAFWSLDLFVDKRVLIPRPETEMLVEIALKFLKPHHTFVDVGTGSGAIAISLLYESKKTLYALMTDISEDALNLAQINMNQYKKNFSKDSSMKFYQGDRLFPLESKWQGEIDLIISNPPYIKSKQDREFVHPSVLKFEPHQALFLEDETYFQWFMDFFEQAKLFLKKNQEGLFLMEGHEKHLDELAKMALQMGFDQVKVMKDLAHKKRFLSMTLN